MHREDDTKAVLGVPAQYRLQHIISLGYPLPVAQTVPVAPQRKRKPLEEIVMREKW
jgi:hypothetical protein